LLQNCNTLFSFFLKKFLILFEKQQQFMLNELEIKKTQYSIYLEPKIVERQSVRKIETRGETVV